MEELNICGRNLLNLDVTEGRKNYYGGIFGDENVRISIGWFLEVFDIPLVSELFGVVLLGFGSALNNQFSKFFESNLIKFGLSLFIFQDN